MLRDNLVELIEPMLISAGADPLPLCIHNQPQASDDRLPCLENPRPAGAEPSLTENVTSPFQAEPAQRRKNAPISVMAPWVKSNDTKKPVFVYRTGSPQ